MHPSAPECTTSNSAQFGTTDAALDGNMSAPTCGCGKALESLRGKVADALALLHQGRVEEALEFLADAMNGGAHEQH